MNLPLQIAFHNMKHSATIAELLHRKSAALGRFSDNIVGCRIDVDRPHNHLRKGNPYQVRVDISVPGEEIAVTSRRHVDKKLHVAVQEAFDAARRQLEDYERRRRGV